MTQTQNIDDLANQVSTLNVQQNPDIRQQAIEALEAPVGTPLPAPASAPVSFDGPFIIVLIVAIILFIIMIIFLALYIKAKSSKKENYLKVETTTGNIQQSFRKRNGQFAETTTMKINGKTYRNRVKPFIYQN